MKKIFILTNIPVPYKVDFYNELGKKCDLTVVFEARRIDGQKFNWNDNNELSFNTIYLSDVLNEKVIHFKVAKFIKKKYFDLFLITTYHTFTGQFVLCLLKLYRLRYWFETDGAFVTNNENRIKYWYKRFMIKGASLYLSPCVSSDNYLLNYGVRNETIHRYPFASTLFSETLQKTLSKAEKIVLRKQLSINSNKMIVAVGQFIRRKGFDVLIKAIADRDLADVCCYIVGGEATAEYKNLINKYNLHNIHFIKFLDRKALSCYYQASDIFVLPTREDIWGLVINEAMANGLPIITTTKCNAGLTLVNKDNGVLVDVDDIIGLRRAIKEIIYDDTALSKMGSSSIEKIQGYTIEKMAEAHNSLINNTL